jgi:hypothetical protein
MSPNARCWPFRPGAIEYPFHSEMSIERESPVRILTQHGR